MNGGGIEIAKNIIIDPFRILKTKKDHNGR